MDISGRPGLTRAPQQSFPSRPASLQLKRARFPLSLWKFEVDGLMTVVDDDVRIGTETHVSVGGLLTGEPAASTFLLDDISSQ